MKIRNDFVIYSDSSVQFKSHKFPRIERYDRNVEMLHIEIKDVDITYSKLLKFFLLFLQH